LASTFIITSTANPYAYAVAYLAFLRQRLLSDPTPTVVACRWQPL